MGIHQANLDDSVNTQNKRYEAAQAAAEAKAKSATEKTGIANPTITYAHVKREIGEKDAKMARMSQIINWKTKGSGASNSGVFCLRSEFDKWNMNR